MKAPYTAFGKTRNVEVKVYKNALPVDSQTWDCELWVEDSNDWYAFASPKYKDKLVRVIERAAWLKSL